MPEITPEGYQLIWPLELIMENNTYIQTEKSNKVNSIRLRNNLSKKDMIRLIRENVKKCGAAAFTVNSSKHLRVFADAYNAIFKEEGYSGRAIGVADLVINVVFSAEIAANPEAMRTIMQQVVESVVPAYNNTRL